MNESEHKARGRYVLEQVLPVLLNDGLYNKNEDIAKFSLNTISKSKEYSLKCGRLRTLAYER